MAWHKGGYGVYYSDAGSVIERTSNPDALPCYRWRIIDGPGAGKADFTLAGAKRMAERAEARKPEGC